MLLQDTTLLEVCSLLASERGCDPRQVFLLHRTSTLDLLSTVRDNSLTTVDIVGGCGLMCVDRSISKDHQNASEAP